jgi:hypothetical protein
MGEVSGMFATKSRQELTLPDPSPEHTMGANQYYESEGIEKTTHYLQRRSHVIWALDEILHEANQANTHFYKYYYLYSR